MCGPGPCKFCPEAVICNEHASRRVGRLGNGGARATRRCSDAPRRHRHVLVLFDHSIVAVKLANAYLLGDRVEKNKRRGKADVRAAGLLEQGCNADGACRCHNAGVLCNSFCAVRSVPCAAAMYAVVLALNSGPNAATHLAQPHTVIIFSPYSKSHRLCKPVQIWHLR